MPSGRISKFKYEYCAEAARLCAMFGAIDRDLAVWFGVDESTITRWKERYPVFRMSIIPAKETYDAQIERRLAERAMGYKATDTKFATFEGQITDREEYIKEYPPDTTAAIFWLTNRKRKEWKRVPDFYDDDDNVLPVKVIIGREDASKPDRSNG